MASKATRVTGPWPAEWNSKVLHQIASGLVELARQTAELGEIPVPYPSALQNGLNRFSAMGITVNAEIPRSVMDLVTWAHRPFGEWPFLPDVEGLDDNESLLVDGKPTETCLAWATANGGDESGNSPD